MIERERLPEDFTERVFEDIVDCYEGRKIPPENPLAILNRAFAEVQAVTMLGNAYDMSVLEEEWKKDAAEGSEKANPVVPRMLAIIAKHQTPAAALVREAGRYMNRIENTGDGA